MSIEAMKLAEDALFGPWEGCVNSIEGRAITALRQAIEQAQKQEPVAFPRNVQEYDEDWIVDPAFITRVKQSIDPETPYDFTPTMEQVETTLLALEVIPASLFTSPPQRQPLTRGQIREIEVDVSLNPSFDYITPAEQLCRAIEAAHGITGEQK